MKIKDSALKALIAEVEAEIGSLLKSEGEKLAKAADDLDQEAEEKPEESAPAAEMSAPSEDPSAEDSAEASAPMEDAPMEDAPMGDAPEASAGDAQAAPEGAEGGQMDTEALKAEYMKLPPEELEMHFMAAKAAMEALMGGADQGAEGLGAGAPAPAPEGAPAPAMKAEPAAKKASLMEKSEKNTASDSRLQELEAQVEGLVKALDLALGQPMRKAVTSVAYVPRTEETKPSLSKGEVVEKLKEITKQPLKKSDRELINRYCLGEVEVDKIQHLLQGK